MRFQVKHNGKYHSLILTCGTFYHNTLFSRGLERLEEYIESELFWVSVFTLLIVIFSFPVPYGAR